MMITEKIKRFIKNIYPDKTQKPQFLKLFWATILDFGWLFLIEWLFSILTHSEYIGIAGLFSNDEVEYAIAKAALVSRSKVFICFFVLETMLWIGVRANHIKKQI